MNDQETKLRHKGFEGTAEVCLASNCLHGAVRNALCLLTYEGQTVPELRENFKAEVERYIAYIKGGER